MKELVRGIGSSLIDANPDLDGQCREMKLAVRMSNAKVRKKYMQANFVDRIKEASPELRPGYRKASSLSKLRAIAKDPKFATAMIEKFYEQDRDLYASGVLKTPHPLAHQVHNGDEMAIPPEGSSWAKVYSMGRDTHERIFRVLGILLFLHLFY